MYGNAAKEALRKTPQCTKLLVLQFLTEKRIEEQQSPSTLRLLQSSLELLSEMRISKAEWNSIRHYLAWADTEIVLACAEIGIRNAPAKEHAAIVSNIFRIVSGCNWLQESRAIEILETWKSLACSMALARKNELLNSGAQPNLLNPMWRAIDHMLDFPAQSDVPL
jgi:hypothetical protein